MSIDEQPSFFAQPMNRTIAIVAVVVLAIAASIGGYFLLGEHHGTSSSSATKVVHSGAPLLMEAANKAAAAETGEICDRALTRAKSYGVVPDATALTSKETAGATEGSFTCAASANGVAFTLMVQKTCEDIAQHDCLALHRVSAGGAVLFERQL